MDINKYRFKTPDRDYYTTSILGLIKECPAKVVAADCPLKEVRLMSVKEQATWFKMLKPKEVGDIIDMHFECSAKRKNN